MVAARRVLLDVFVVERDFGSHSSDPASIGFDHTATDNDASMESKFFGSLLG